MTDIEETRINLFQAIENIVTIWHQGVNITETEISILLKARSGFALALWLDEKR